MPSPYKMSKDSLIGEIENIVQNQTNFKSPLDIVGLKPSIDQEKSLTSIKVDILNQIDEQDDDLK